jgi:enoyl-[acyl-carrier-protein] reductase (NADH)
MTRLAQHRPKPPFPARKLHKPCLESDLVPRPRYLAPSYKAAEKLLDKRALITGGDSGIGRAVAVLFAREGADVAIVYLPQEQPDAEETRRAVEATGRTCVLIPGDLTRPAFCKQAVDRAIRKLGGLDILVSNAGYQNRKTLDELTPEEFAAPSRRTSTRTITSRATRCPA